jgi:hypothetical protein
MRLIIAFLVGTVSSVHADDMDMHSLTIWNTGDVELGVAVAVEDGEGFDPPFFLKGWYSIAPGSRATVAQNNYPASAVFFVAFAQQDANGQWGIAEYEPDGNYGARVDRSTKVFCVGTQNFKRTGTRQELRQCPEGFVPAKFSMFVDLQGIDECALCWDGTVRIAAHRGAPVQPPVAAAGPAAAPAPFALSSISLGKRIGADKKVAEELAVFAPTETIYASVNTTGVSPSVTLKARWTYEQGELVNESQQTITPTGPAVTEFHIAKASGWPTGKYQVEISSAAGTLIKRFEVR